MPADLSTVPLIERHRGTLDIRSVDTLYALLSEYRQGGGLAELSSHQCEALQSLCDIFVLMHAGQILAAGHLPFLRDAAELPADAGLREVYLALLEDPSLPDPAGVTGPGV